MRDGHHVRTLAIDSAVQKTLEEPRASTRLTRLALQGELHDVVGRHQRRRERAGHQEPLRVVRVSHRYVTGRIEHPLVGEDATGRRKVFEYPTLDRATWQ